MIPRTMHWAVWWPAARDRAPHSTRPLAGGDGDAQIGQALRPTMSTIDFPAVEMGRQGAEMLIRRLEGGETASSKRWRSNVGAARHGRAPD